MSEMIDLHDLLQYAGTLGGLAWLWMRVRAAGRENAEAMKERAREDAIWRTNIERDIKELSDGQDRIKRRDNILEKKLEAILEKITKMELELAIVIKTGPSAGADKTHTRD